MLAPGRQYVYKNDCVLSDINLGSLLESEMEAILTCLGIVKYLEVQEWVNGFMTHEPTRNAL